VIETDLPQWREGLLFRGLSRLDVRWAL